jgi:hypothetical protein
VKRNPISELASAVVLSNGTQIDQQTTVTPEKIIRAASLTATIKNKCDAKDKKGATSNCTYPYHEVEGDHFLIHRDKDKVWSIPRPVEGGVYKIQEFVIMMYDQRTNHGLDSYKTLVLSLAKLGILNLSYDKYAEFHSAYVDSERKMSVLPSPDRYVMRKGCKRRVAVHDCITTANKKAHTHLSLVTSSKDDAIELLKKKGSNIDDCCGIPNSMAASRDTIKRISDLSETDPNITLVNMKAQRLKNQSRFIASMSYRNTATHALGAISSQF